MILISNYLYTIGKYLPPATRAEILKEIEANLYDYLEENFVKKEYTDEEIEKKNPMITHCDNPDCERCNDAVQGGPILMANF